MTLIIQNIKKNIYELSFLLFFVIFSTYFYYLLNLVLGDNWAYNEFNKILMTIYNFVNYNIIGLLKIIV